MSGEYATFSKESDMTAEESQWIMSAVLSEE
jgi:hypothetical protein